MIEREEREAPAAIEALSRVASGEELKVRLESAVTATGSVRLAKALRESAMQRKER